MSYEPPIKSQRISFDDEQPIEMPGGSYEERDEFVKIIKEEIQGKQVRRITFEVQQPENTAGDRDSCFENIKEEIKDFVRQETDAILGSLHAKLNAIMEKLDKQSAIIGSIQSEQKKDEGLRHIFPIKNADEMAKINSQINNKNRHQYIRVIKNVLKDAVYKNLIYILSSEFVMAFNINGSNGKEALKDYTNFYEALLEAIPFCEEKGTADKQLRKALQLIKNRHFKSVSHIKKMEKDSFEVVCIDN